MALRTPSGACQRRKRSLHVMGNFDGKKRLAQDMPGHVQQSIQLSRGQNRSGVDADWSELDGVHIGATWRVANTIETSVCSGGVAICQINFTTFCVYIISEFQYENVLSNQHTVIGLVYD